MMYLVSFHWIEAIVDLCIRASKGPHKDMHIDHSALQGLATGQSVCARLNKTLDSRRVESSDLLGAQSVSCMQE